MLKGLAILVMTIGISLTAVHAAATVLLNTDFEKNPLEQGWHNAGAGSWTEAPARNGQRCLRCANPEGSWAVWSSPAFPVRPFEYYRVQFSHQGGGMSNNICAIYYDEKAEPLVSDTWESFAPSEHWQTMVRFFTPAYGATHARIMLRSDKGKTDCIDDITVTTATRAEVAAWADTVAAGLPRIDIALPVDRLQYLPRTLQALQSGKTLRVVMLGDSIINDTGNSHWETLVERMYPQARLEVVRSVRGSAGCMYYEQENRVQSYVLDYAPDLLIIGGISYREQERTDGEAVASVRNVIRQVRQKNAGEIMVMTGALSSRGYNPRTVDNWQPFPTPEGTDYRSLLMKMASEEGVAFLDMAGIWGRYTLTVDQPYDWFLRDTHHGNWRAKQVLARMLEAFFALK